MPGNVANLAEMRADLRERLDETMPNVFWKDSWLNKQINEGARDVARQTECLENRATITTVQGQGEYPGVLPLDLIRIYRLEFANTSNDVYPLEIKSPHAMDTRWSGYRQASSLPSTFTVWGPVGTSQTLIIYPADSIGGKTLTLWYYRLPAMMLSDSDILDLPLGWGDVPLLYAESKALRKDRSQGWQEAEQLYKDKLNEMIVLTNKHTDQTTDTFGEDRVLGLPPWLVSTDTGYYWGL